MPLLHHNKVNNDCSLNVWLITETERELVAELHSYPYLEELATITNPVKRKEWLAARAALIDLIILHNGKMQEIKKDDHGKPFLHHSQYISLAHSYPYAASIFHKSLKAGIDIEQVQPKLIKVAARFLNPDELNHTAADPDTTCIYWTAKEALFKMYGRKKCSFREHLHIFPFQPKPSGCLQTQVTIENKTYRHQVNYYKLQDYYISYCFAG